MKVNLGCLIYNFIKNISFNFIISLNKEFKIL